MLLAVAGWGLTLPRPGDATPYHDAVLATAAEAPFDVGPYDGQDAIVAPAAVELLRPNLLLSRSYVPLEGEAGDAALSPWVQLLVVQVRDARDILGHWPPVCYESNGYTPGPVEDTSWTIDGRELPGRRYRFSQTDAAGARTGMVVANFLVLPDGRVVRDMTAVIEAGGDYRIRYFGAAQVQVLTPDTLSENDRAATEDLFLDAHAALIAEMASGVRPEEEPAPASASDPAPSAASAHAAPAS